MLLDECTAITTDILTSDFYATKHDLGPLARDVVQSKYRKEVLIPRLAALETVLGRNTAMHGREPKSTRAPHGLSHFVSSYLTIADLAAYSLLCFLVKQVPDCLEPYTHLTAFLEEYTAM